jgi:hypothetical protein
LRHPVSEDRVSSPITVQVDAVARFDVALQVGNVTQEVEVTAAAPLLQSDRADVAQTFDAASDRGTAQRRAAIFRPSSC